eukprot:TRINITY_DN682_c0_g3_i1.p2 TRINITY_DN682_c0_g3~~TRINITY_DN682_c0_g3_i1.p2  ORF type:complete len:199 (+),score=67.23 TRINITY_DN682_c0_g3_i1:77-673(+)
MKKERKIQILTLGNSKVGKTSILKRYENDKIPLTHITTLGVDLITKKLALGGDTVVLKIWDTAGQERFRTITHTFYKQAEGVLLVFDLTDRESFESLSAWIKTIQDHADERIVKYLVGNKADLAEERKVNKQEALHVANHYKMKYYETSARNNVNVKEVIEDITKEVYETISAKETHTQIHGRRNTSDNQGKGCCIII